MSDLGREIALDTARHLAEQEFGHMLASDLLAEARRRNPGVTMRFESGATGVLLVVETARGTVRRARNPHEGWHATFSALGLL